MLMIHHTKAYHIKEAIHKNLIYFNSTICVPYKIYNIGMNLRFILFLFINISTFFNTVLVAIGASRPVDTDLTQVDFGWSTQKHDMSNNVGAGRPKYKIRKKWIQLICPIGPMKQEFLVPRSHCSFSCLALRMLRIHILTWRRAPPE